MKRMAAFTLLLFVLCSSIAMGGWEPYNGRNLYSSTTGSHTSPNNAWCVAATSTGVVHVVWFEVLDPNYPQKQAIYYLQSTDWGVTWLPMHTVAQNNSMSEYPSVAVSGSVIHVVWDENRSGGLNNQIYYARSTDGVAWTETLLSTSSSNANDPCIAVSGLAVNVVWMDRRDGNYEIYQTRSNDGGLTWKPVHRLTTDIDESWNPSIAMSGSTVHLVWQDQKRGSGNPQFRIWYMRSIDGGATWTTLKQLSSPVFPYESNHPSVAVLGSKVYVVWDDNRDGNQEIYFRRSLDGGVSWFEYLPDTRLTNYWGISMNPSVTALGSNVDVVWSDDRNGTGSEIYYKHSGTSGVSWGADDRRTWRSFGSNGSGPSIAVVSFNYLYVVWQDSRDPDHNFDIYFQRYVSTGGSGDAGVEEGEKGLKVGSPTSLKVTPNPFTSSASIPGHEAERFTLYDVSGRQVGSYLGCRIGADVRPGIYFLKPEGKNAKPLRIVKLR